MADHAAAAQAAPRRQWFRWIAFTVLFGACAREAPRDDRSATDSTGIAGVRDSATIKTLRTAYIPVTANLPLFVALREGYFERCGVRVDAAEATSPNDIMNGLIAGHLDFAAVMAYPIIFPAYLRAPDAFKLYSATEETPTQFTSSIVTRDDSRLRRPEDLRGKRIGVYGGIVQVNFLKAILIGMEIDPDSVTIVEISPRLQIQGLLANQYDALSTTEPTANIARIQGHARTLVKSPRVRYIMSPFPSTAATVSTRLLRNDPEAARCVIGSLDAAVDLIRQRPEYAKRFLVPSTPIPPAIQDSVLADLKLFHYLRSDEVDPAGVQRFADYMFENRLLPQRIPNVRVLFGDTSRATTP
jgi:ABC-type nitrate/sulfonate/bicarbonate transport system substrate-binding protein